MFGALVLCSRTGKGRTRGSGAVSQLRQRSGVLPGRRTHPDSDGPTPLPGITRWKFPGKLAAIPRGIAPLPCGQGPRVLGAPQAGVERRGTHRVSVWWDVHWSPRAGRGDRPTPGPRGAARAGGRTRGCSADGPAGLGLGSPWSWFGGISPASRWGGPQRSLSHAVSVNFSSPPWPGASRVSVHSGLRGGLILLLALLVAGSPPGSGLCTSPSRSPWVWGGNGDPTPQNVLFQPPLPRFPAPCAVPWTADTAAGQRQRLAEPVHGGTLKIP